MSRGLWFPVSGKQETVGSCGYTISYAERSIIASPNKAIDSDNAYFEMLESQLRARGYEPRIHRDGRVFVTIPVQDKYGWVLREIARAYWLTTYARRVTI